MDRSMLIRIYHEGYKQGVYDMKEAMEVSMEDNVKCVGDHLEMIDEYKMERLLDDVEREVENE